jgi:hypothetical protein
MKHATYILMFAGFLVLAGFSCRTDSNHAGIPTEIQKEAKPWAYWWWMGNSVTPEGITANLEKYSKAGMGGMHIIPIYGEKGDESNFIEYVSPGWMEMLKHTVSEAERLGMGIDMTCGTGWPFGGPFIGEEYAAKAFEVIELKDSDPFQPGDLFPKAEGLKLVSVAGYDIEDKYLDIPFTTDGEGKIIWKMPGPDYKVYALFQRMTRQKVKRAAPGGEGYVVDYFSKSASQSYFQKFRKAFGETEFNSGRVRSFYNDSYEVYGANWTNDFPEQFEKLRGYSLMPYIKYLSDTIANQLSERVKVDFQETISDLLRDEFTQDWVEASHSMGFLTRYQAHGSPGNLIDLYSLADIPETESFGRSNFPIPGLRQDEDYQEEKFGKPTPFTIKFASSAAHLSNRKLVSSETATWLGDHFKVSLSQVKPQLDELFVSGINHIIYHGITYSPPDKPFPGRLFYASTNFGPHSHFWDELPALNQYLANCQNVLQNTSPDNDILVYFPIHDVWSKNDPRRFPRMFEVHHANDWLMESPFGTMIQELWYSGYTFDYISDLKLEELKVHKKRALVGNSSYRAILVPECKTMPLHTLERLEELAGKGIPVIFEKDLPDDVPGLHQLEERRQKLTDLKAGMKRSGKTRVSSHIKKELMNSGIVAEGLSEKGVSFIRKSSGDQTLYFVTNLSASACAEWIPLSVLAGSIEIYDPMNGRQGLAKTRSIEKGTGVFLQLAPGESRILTCYPGKSEIEPWSYPDPNESQTILLSGKWLLTAVDGAPQLPEPAEMEDLASWTSLGEDWEIFSGAVVYSTTFQLPAEYVERSFMLNLGDVRETGRVKINGHDMGLSWSVPFRLIVPRGILEESNTLEIEVRNLSFNRVIDLDRKGVPWKNFHEINFVDITYNPYDASDAEPMPSGLLQPVTLTPLK